MALKHLRKTERLLLAACVVLVALAFLNHFAFVPMVNRMLSLKKEIRKEELSLARNRRIVARQSEIRKRYESRMESVKISASREEEVALFLKEIDGLSRKAKIKIVDLKPREVRVYEHFNKSVVDIEFEANQSSLAVFLFELAESPLGISIEQLTVSAKTERQELSCSTIISRILVE